MKRGWRGVANGPRYGAADGGYTNFTAVPYAKDLDGAGVDGAAREAHGNHGIGAETLGLGDHAALRHGAGLVGHLGVRLDLAAHQLLHACHHVAADVARGDDVAAYQPEDLDVLTGYHVCGGDDHGEAPLRLGRMRRCACTPRVRSIVPQPCGRAVALRFRRPARLRFRLSRHLPPKCAFGQIGALSGHCGGRIFNLHEKLRFGNLAIGSGCCASFRRRCLGCRFGQRPDADDGAAAYGIKPACNRLVGAGKPADAVRVAGGQFRVSAGHPIRRSPTRRVPRLAALIKSQFAVTETDSSGPQYPATVEQVVPFAGRCHEHQPAGRPERVHEARSKMDSAKESAQACLSTRW